MTLVAGISLGGMPAFIGDLLISRRLPAPADLPTRPENAVHPGEDGFFAASLAQKLVIVRPYFLLAWAGSRSTADRILRELDRLLPDDFDASADSAPVWDVLNSCEEGSEMVVLIIGNGMVQPLGIRTRGFEIDGKRVYLMGSGGPAFFDYLNAHTDVVPEGDGGGLVARAAVLRFGARAIQTQWISGGGLEASWGGGFEVVFPEPNGFRKIDRILFRAWRIDAAGNYFNSGRSFFVRYYGGNLYLSAFNPGERTYVVASPIGTDIKPPPFEIAQAAWTVDMFVHEPTGSLIEFARFQPDDRPTEDFVELTDGVLTGWSMDQAFVERCVRTALNHAGKGDVFRMERY
jgi:hypothetical protein